MKVKGSLRVAVAHGLAFARVARAACRVALVAAVGALYCAVAVAQSQIPTVAPPAAPTAALTGAAAEAVQAPAGPTTQAPSQDAAANGPAALSRPFAAPSVTSSAAPSGIASLGQVTLALGLVLALIFVAAWLMRRLRGFGRTGTGALDIIADLPVGQKERAVLIRVGTQQVLLGVAPGRVSTLHVLDEPVSVTPPATGPTGPTGPTSIDRPTFKSLLMKSLGK